MTIAMPDSINVDQLPPGYPAYLGYVDGNWPTAAALKAKFPGAHILTLTVLGGSEVADGCDCETGDLTPESSIEWAAWRLVVDSADHPVIYASASTMNGAILPGLTAEGIDRSRVRLLSAHYGQGAHICGPRTCGLVTVDCDGTQWTDKFGWPNIDMSVLRDDFFGTAPQPTWQEIMMQQLPTLQQGATGAAVRTVQGLCVARNHMITVNGVFNPVTEAAVKNIQANANITVDGIVGPQTWPVLMGIA